MQIRQGDVLLQKFNGTIPEGAVKVTPKAGRYVLAEGEATGHAHTIVESDAVALYEKDGVLYLKVLEPNPMEHQEHSVVTPDSGIWFKPPQVEWSSAMEPRRVTD